MHHQTTPVRRAARAAAGLALQAGRADATFEPNATGAYKAAQTGETRLAGLVAAVADGDVVPGQPVVFLHSGGLPGLFGHPELAGLTEGR